jgi:arylformamidase
MIHDVSWPLGPGTTTWPGMEAPRCEHVLSRAGGDAVDYTRWTIDAHAGTHVDAPSHFLPGATVERLPLEPFVGPCRVIDLTRLGHRHVDADDLRRAVPAGTERVLLRTVNSLAPPTGAFRPDFVALTGAAAEWLVDSGALAIGVDGLSVEPFDAEDHVVHHRLLGGGVAVIEGLRLGDVAAGPYVLSCLPLALVDSDGAPARAVLLPAP